MYWPVHLLHEHRRLVRECLRAYRGVEGAVSLMTLTDGGDVTSCGCVDRCSFGLMHWVLYRLTESETAVHATFQQCCQTDFNGVYVFFLSRGLYFVSEKLNIEDMLHNVQAEW